MAMLRRNVLIFHSGALGDFVLSWPVGLALGRLFPQSRIFYVTQKGKGELAEKVLRLESTDVELGWHHLFGDAGNLPEACRNRLVSAHSVVSFVADSGDAWTQALASIAPDVDLITLNARVPSGGKQHASFHMLEALSPHPTVKAAVQQMLSSIAANGILAGRSSTRGGPIIIHPGSGAVEKCWPVAKFIELAGRIKRQGRECKFILGEVELERWPREVISRLESAAKVIRPQSYLALLAELAGASAFVGNDSGPGHLAGIIGLPTLSLFGPSDPAVWRPLGPQVAVLRHQPLGDLSVEVVEKALEQVTGRI